MQKLFILAKLKLTGLTEKEFASSKALIKLFMGISTMANFRVKESFISQQVIIIWVNLDLIKKKEGEFITGLVNKAMFMKDNLKLVSVMGVELFGGVTEAGTKASLEMGFKVGGEFCTGKEATANMKEIGIMECLMERVLNTSKTARDTRVHSKKISSMVRAFSIKTIQLSMEFGKIMNFQLSIWSNQVLEINDNSLTI